MLGLKVYHNTPCSRFDSLSQKQKLTYLDGLTSQAETSWSPSRHWNFRQELLWWRSELWFSYLHSKHFTKLSHLSRPLCVCGVRDWARDLNVKQVLWHWVTPSALQLFLMNTALQEESFFLPGLSVQLLSTKTLLIHMWTGFKSLWSYH